MLDANPLFLINFFSKLLISKSLSLPSIYFPFFLFLLPSLPSFLISLLSSHLPFTPFLDIRYSSSIISLFFLNVIHPLTLPSVFFKTSLCFSSLFPSLPPPSPFLLVPLWFLLPLSLLITLLPLSLFSYLLLPLSFSLFLTHFFSFFFRWRIDCLW